MPDVAAAPGGLTWISSRSARRSKCSRPVDARAAELVKLRFFAGLTRHEAAEVLGISVATADNDWAYAKGWLKADTWTGTAGTA